MCHKSSFYVKLLKQTNLCTNSFSSKAWFGFDPIRCCDDPGKSQMHRSNKQENPENLGKSALGSSLNSKSRPLILSQTASGSNKYHWWCDFHNHMNSRIEKRMRKWVVLTTTIFSWWTFLEDRLVGYIDWKSDTKISLEKTGTFIWQMSTFLGARPEADKSLGRHIRKIPSMCLATK